MSDDQLDEISIRAAEATGAVSDTPRTDACPHCGDKYDSEKFFRYECGTLQQFPSGTIRTELCHQTEVSNIWQKRAEKAEAEVERLKDLCDWAETLLCNAEPPKHSTEEEWSQLVTKFRSELHPIQTK